VELAEPRAAGRGGRAERFAGVRRAGLPRASARHPTEGRIRIKGRVGSLLEVGTGFHPELTGRENIYLNGTILGMTRPEVTRKLDEIVAFAEMAQFIDTPVKRYSSGMTVRLAFAVAAHLEPEILVVDEVLAVGDPLHQALHHRAGRALRQRRAGWKAGGPSKACDGETARTLSPSMPPTRSQGAGSPLPHRRALAHDLLGSALPSPNRGRMRHEQSFNAV